MTALANTWQPALADGANGIVHLPRLSRTDVRADLVLRPGEPIVLPAGQSKDGRPVVLQVLVHPPHGR